MTNLVPLTKIILTFAISAMAIVLSTPLAIACLVLAEVVLLALAGQLLRNAKAVLVLIIFAILLGIVQYLGGGSVASAFVTGLRMLAMTFVFILLLTTTRLQDLTASLVTQLKVPYEYAFMFTAALRFVPDFLTENKAVLEAQACRGMDLKGNALRRIGMYFAVVQPMVLRSLSRSETMALSLELRGFGQEGRSFTTSVRPKAMDGLIMLILAVATALAIYLRLHYGY